MDVPIHALGLIILGNRVCWGEKDWGKPVLRSFRETSRQAYSRKCVMTPEETLAAGTRRSSSAPDAHCRHARHAHANDIYLHAGSSDVRIAKSTLQP